MAYRTGMRRGVSIHAPAKERRCEMADYLEVTEVSIHAPAKERHSDNAPKSRNCCFNPRSREGATAACCTALHSAAFQSTLPRRSDDKSLFSQSYVRLVSIHAPAKERPILPIFHIVLCVRFNPRSREGAT